MSISDRLDKIEARADAATEGPWEWDSHIRGNGHVVIGGGLRRAHLPEDVADDADNAEFIAHARTDVPWLIEQVRKRDAALLAVLELHKPETYEGPGRICEGCDYGAMDPPEWPCPTVRIVTAALGEES